MVYKRLALLHTLGTLNHRTALMVNITPEMRRFGSLIASYRKRAGLTQEETAALSERVSPPGVRRDYLASIEAGKIKIVYPRDFNALRRALQFPGFELLEAMGYETDGGVDDIDPVLVAVSRQLDRDSQRALATMGRTLIKAQST